MEILKDLITNASTSFAAIVLFVCVLIGSTIGMLSYRREARLKHQEKMATVETTHRENMLRIGRENPKVIENDSQKSRPHY